MKIIFSRKGFDSKAGGKPSIVCNDKIISFPIPQANSGDFYYMLHSDLGFTYDKIFRDLEITQYSEAHVDPDLYEGIFGENRPNGWRGVFGQDSGAQTHLKKMKVSEGDIFLFFGWYKTAKQGKNGKIKYDKYGKFKDGFHMLYGFLEIGNILKIGEDRIPEWAENHTHVKNNSPYKKESLNKTDNNYLYLSAEKSIHGLSRTYGIFNKWKHLDDLILSQKGGNTKSVWQFDTALNGCKISHHGDNAEISNRPFQTVSQGQEFVVQAHETAKKWVIDFINGHIQ